MYTTRDYGIVRANLSQLQRCKMYRTFINIQQPISAVVAATVAATAAAKIAPCIQGATLRPTRQLGVIFGCQLDFVFSTCVRYSEIVKLVLS